MSIDPDEIREDIQRTRDNLSHDVDALAYKASPSRMVQERKDRVLDAIHGVRNKVMGTASDAGDRASAATSALSDAASSVADSAAAATGNVKRAAEGNPLAAGLIVFGAAWLASSLLPKSEPEQRAAQQVKTAAQEHVGPIKDAVGEAAHEMQENLREPVQDAVSSLKSTVTDAARTVKEDSVDGAQSVRGDVMEARDEITSRP